jgi:hypothetical protein
MGENVWGGQQSPIRRGLARRVHRESPVGFQLLAESMDSVVLSMGFQVSISGLNPLLDSSFTPDSIGRVGDTRVVHEVMVQHGTRWCGRAW